MPDLPPTLTRPLRKTLLLLGILLAGVGVGSAIVRWYIVPQRMLALLHAAPESQIALRMDHLLDHASVPRRVLAQLLSSPRPEIAVEACRRLENLVEQWEQRPGNEVSENAVQLVNDLRRQLPHCSPGIQRQISGIASRMAGWNLGHPPAEQAAFLLAIEEIARASSSPSSPASSSAASEAMLTQFLERSQPPTSASRAIAAPTEGSLAVKLSAGIPWDSVDLPNVPEVARGKETASPLGPVVLSGGPSSPRVEREANQPLTARPPLKLPRLRDEPKALDSVRDEVQMPLDFENLTTWEVIWKLHAPNKQHAIKAELALKARRFDPSDLELARRISAPDVATRLQAVRELPTLPRSDMKTWLYLMTKDPDETVRYSAAAALLTSADPRLHRQLSLELAADPSRRVRELVRR